MTLTADQIKTLFAMQPHPTCGFFAQSYQSSGIQIPAGALPPEFAGPRPLASALYFLVTADTQTALHRIHSDQIYHHYAGDPLEVLLLRGDGPAGVVIVGADLAAGQRPQLLVPADTFHISRVRPGGAYAFMGTTAWPDVLPADIELGDVEQLMAAFPAVRDQIAAFTGRATHVAG